MSQFPADGKSGLAVQLAQLPVEGLAVRASGGRCLPAGQFFIAVLGVGMTQAVHLGKAGAQGVAFVDAHLVPVVAVARNQGAEAGKAAGTVQHIALRHGKDRDDPLPATLGPAGLELKY